MSTVHEGDRKQRDLLSEIRINPHLLNEFMKTAGIDFVGRARTLYVIYNRIREDKIRGIPEKGCASVIEHRPEGFFVKEIRAGDMLFGRTVGEVSIIIWGDEDIDDAMFRLELDDQYLYAYGNEEITELELRMMLLSEPSFEI